MKDRHDQDGAQRDARGNTHDDSWRGRDQTKERERDDGRNHRRTSGFEPGGVDRGYDRNVDDRGYDRGPVGWHDRGERPDNFHAAPRRGYAEPFEMGARQDADLHHRDYHGPYGDRHHPYREIPTRMMDDHPMASAYRSPAERPAFDGWRPDRWREDGWQRQARGFDDPGRHPAPSHEPFRGDQHSRERDWRPDQSPLYGVTGAGWTAGSYAAASSRGKPPRGYVRTDERVHEDICERMAHQGDDWSDVEVKVKDGEVTLTGQVEMRRQKYAAEHLTDGVRGVREIHNQIRVGNGTSTGEASPIHNGSDAKQRRTSS